MIVMGIDPGLANVGYGVIEHRPEQGDVIHVVHGVIQTHRRDSTALRLKAIFEGLSGLISLHKPAEVAIEELFFATNVKTAIAVAQARGVAILATAEADLPVAEYTPLQMKQSLVGYGRASKQQVQMMVKASLGLAETPHPDHAADALAAAICHVHSRGLALRIDQAAREAADTGIDDPNKALLSQTRRRRPRR